MSLYVTGDEVETEGAGEAGEAGEGAGGEGEQGQDQGGEEEGEAGQVLMPNLVRAMFSG